MALILNGTTGITVTDGSNILQDGTVTTDDLAAGAVTSAKMATGAAATNLGNYVQSFNGSTGAVTGVSTFNGATGAVTGVASFNGSTGAVTYTAPVTSVNGQTGAVTISSGPPTVSAGTVYYGQPKGWGPFYNQSWGRKMYVTMGVSGTIRARASASSWTNGEGANQYAQIQFYKNGVAQGSSVTPSLGSSSTLTTDISVSPGDNVELYGQIYGYNGGGAGMTGIEIGVSSGTFVPSTTNQTP